MWSLNLVTAPAAAAVDLTSEVVPYLKLSAAEASEQAVVLAQAIKGATDACETNIFRQLITAIWEVWLDGWNEPELYGCGTLRLPKAPLQQQAGSPVDHGVLSVKYLDTNGTLQTLAADQYQILAPAGPQARRGLIFRAYGVSWPSVRSQPGAIKVRYTAGYGDSFASVPAGIKQGLLKRVASLYDGRDEASMPPIGRTAEHEWWPFKAW